MFKLKKKITTIFAVFLSISMSIPTYAKPNPPPGDISYMEQYYKDNTFRKAGSRGGSSIEGITIKVMQMPTVENNSQPYTPLKGVEVYWIDSAEPSGLTNEEGIWTNPDVIPVERHTIVLKGKNDVFSPVSVSYTIDIPVALSEPIVLIWPYRNDPNKKLIRKNGAKVTN